ncbi:putative lipoprotein with Yx(FWY)xxD motif [Pseudomonas sp. W3I7]|uniref:hypothetical protein n=1 Tax=Pseudomonas sp. W3I7 TaxID=3042292 RepID=UPI0027919BF3|nr:hypothetical protein [Pseudomonas sp. W3I7]MDQ0704227.1 putative lipoprotein with Yx(FWY)xxD motif [Pseudomonas sp. W3I7]
MLKKSFLAAAALLACASSLAIAAPAKVADSAKGKVLVDGHGMTLYTWVKDAKPGDVTGDGVGGNWNLAKP